MWPCGCCAIAPFVIAHKGLVYDTWLHIERVLVNEPCSVSVILLACIDLCTWMLILGYSNSAFGNFGIIPYPAKHGFYDMLVNAVKN